MITTAELSTLINELSDVSRIAKKYQLSDIRLAHPIVGEKKSLHFFLVADKTLSLEEDGGIWRELGNLLKIPLWESERENDFITINPQDFQPNYLKSHYGTETISLLKNSQTEIISFLRDILGFDVSLKQDYQMQESSSQPSEAGLFSVSTQFQSLKLPDKSMPVSPAMHGQADSTDSESSQSLSLSRHSSSGSSF